MIFFFLMFKEFFIGERKIQSSKNQKMNIFFLDVYGFFSVKNEGFGVLKNENLSFLIFLKNF